MASKLCEICGVRPANVRVRVSQNGRERTLDICALDYQRLIGLAQEQDSIAGALRQQTVKVVGKGAEEGRVEMPTNTPNLDKYSRDLTRLARQGKLDPVFGRAQAVRNHAESAGMLPRPFARESVAP
jgi:ATP-dependent Clp protease ATP-binding subunit ClpA